MKNDLEKQLRSLYEESFHDTKDYIDYFFHYKYNPLNIVTLKDDNGRIISATHIFYKKLAYRNKIIDFPYIVAAATREELRGKKIFPTVMKETLLRLKNEKHPFVGLYPFKHSYYAKSDFATINYVINTKFENIIEDESLTVKKYDNLKDVDNIIMDIYKIYNDYCKSFSIFQYRDLNLIKQRINELMSDKGYIITIKKGDIFKGFATISDGLVSECFMDDYSLLKGVKEIENKEINIITGNQKDTNTIIEKLNFENAEINDYAMARIIDVFDFINLNDFKTDKDIDFNVKIKDSVLGERTIKIKSENGVLKAIDADKFVYETSILELTRLVFGNDDNLILPENFKKLFLSENTSFIEQY